MDAFAEVIRARPARDMVLVVKMSGADARPEAAEEIRGRLAERTANLGLGRVSLIERDLTDRETKDLVRCCDCFISLHRSEGFGRFLAEAMLLGRPVIGTAYSGNMEFMNPEVSCLVDFRLIPVAPGAYPFWEDQVWAEPDLEGAIAWMIRLVDDPAWGRRLGRACEHPHPLALQLSRGGIAVPGTVAPDLRLTVSTSPSVCASNESPRELGRRQADVVDQADLTMFRELADLPWANLMLGATPLPALPPESVQRDWCGNSGAGLARQSADFYRLLKESYARHARKPFAASMILDFGCGWGRITRLFAKDLQPSQIFGCDSDAEHSRVVPGCSRDVQTVRDETSAAPVRGAF